MFFSTLIVSGIFSPVFNVSTSPIFSYHLIVLVSSSYVPPSKLDSSTSILYGSVSSKYTTTSPLYVSITPSYTKLYDTLSVLSSILNVPSFVTSFCIMFTGFIL